MTLTDMKDQILSYMTAECPWRDTLHWYDTLDSTNNYAKALAREGAAHGTVVIAGKQTGGRGRLGRSFSSQEGMGVYLSLILRPNCTPDKLMHLTCAAGLAGSKAVERVCGALPDIKWPNDLIFGKKKLGGILTELGFRGNLVDYAIIGIGINCLQKQEDFPEEIRAIATSIFAQTGTVCSPARLAAALIEELYQAGARLLTEKESILAQYRQVCSTLGKDISVFQGDTVRQGNALDIDQDGGLVVRFSDGAVKSVNSGEVSVRGLYGYV